MDSDLLRREYLVAYHYGAGAVWAIISARSPDEITSRFPKLTVYVSPPNWMIEELHESIRRGGVIDIDCGAAPELMTLSNDD
jgi:hypothetical protein